MPTTADPCAPADLLAQWWRLVLKLAHRYHRWALADSAEDLAGEIAAKAMHLFPNFDPGRATFQTWLGQVSWSTAHRCRELALRRAKGNRLEHEEGDRIRLADPSCPDPAETVACQLDKADLLARVAAAVSDLPPGQREMIRRRFGEGATVAPTRRDRLDLVLNAIRERLT